MCVNTRGMCMCVSNMRGMCLEYISDTMIGMHE